MLITVDKEVFFDRVCIYLIASGITSCDYLCPSSRRKFYNDVLVMLNSSQLLGAQLVDCPTIFGRDRSFSSFSSDEPRDALCLVA